MKSSTPPAPALSRQRARLELDRNVVVEAGAGTGKTTLLTDRILFLLVGQQADISRVVALTFTEKAAGEIQLRLALRLADLLAETSGDLAEGPRRDEARSFLEEAREAFRTPPEAVAASASAALERMDQALIGTIHHFAARLLRLYPLEAGVDPSFEVDDGSAFEPLFESEWSAWLELELGEDAPRREAWLELLKSVGLGDLETMARSLCRDEARGCALGATDAMRGRLRELAAWLRGLSSSKPPPGGRSKILERAATAALRLEDLADACAARGPLRDPLDLRPVEASAWPKAWEGAPGAPDEAVYEEAIELACSTSGDAERVVRRAAALVQPFVERFGERYRRRGLVSFFGLLRQARDLVRDQPEVRAQLKARFAALLIDEFQDTDPLQGELLLYLAERPGCCASDWRELELAPGKLFVVGDPKQSIYRFRGADIRAYEQFTRLMVAQGALQCPLQTSFRSHAGVLEPVNAVHRVLMQHQEGLQPAYLPIQAQRPAGPGPGLELAVVRTAPGEKATAESLRAAEAAWIARWIHERCAATQDPGAPGEAAGEARPGTPVARTVLRFRDVAILLRTTTALGPYIDALKSAGLPYAVEADRYFFGTQEVIDLLNLLRVLDDPNDRLSLAGLLRSPLAALDDRELYALQAAGRLDYRLEPLAAALSAGSKTRLAGLWRALRGLREAAGREPLGDFIARVLRETFLVELCSAAYHGEQTASNLLKFARLAAEAGDERGATLKEFIGLVERAVRDAADEGESPLADEQFDAVRILTIHKAKGLEWPVVILPNLGAQPSATDKPAWRLDWSRGVLGLALPGAKASDVAMAFLKREEALRERHEAIRLLYVAMTRARERTILVGPQRPAGERSFAALLNRAGAWPAEGEAADSLTLGGLRIPVASINASDQAPARARGVAPRPALRRPAALAQRWKQRRAAAEAALAPRATSPTQSGLADELEPRPLAEEEARLLPREEARLAGVVCHRVLEEWDFQGQQDLAARVDSACRALRPEAAGADWDAVAAQSRELLASFLRSAAASELASSEILGRELPFVFAEEGQVVRGAIDILYRRAGKLWIGDFKTERPSGSTLRVARRYGVQAKLYRDAVRRALGQPCGFKLLFLRTGEVLAL